MTKSAIRLNNKRGNLDRFLGGTKDTISHPTFWLGGTCPPSPPVAEPLGTGTGKGALTVVQAREGGAYCGTGTGTGEGILLCG